VLGSSFAGPLALMLAREDADNVRGVILSATFLRSPRRRWIQLRFALVGPVIWTVRATRRLPVWALRRRDDAFRRAKAETWARVSARVLAARARAVVGVDVREVLRHCACPVLCVAFDEDDVVPRANADEILQCCPAAHLVVLQGGHLAMHMDPDPLAGEVARFIDSVERP
jgi:pimeloyl-ACP methyl ester carboxylesterase